MLDAMSELMNLILKLLDTKETETGFAKARATNTKTHQRPIEVGFHESQPKMLTGVFLNQVS